MKINHHVFDQVVCLYMLNQIFVAGCTWNPILLLIKHIRYKITFLNLLHIHSFTISNQQESQADILDGYVPIQSDDGQHSLVPHLMIPATHQAMEAYCKKVEFNVHDAYGGGKLSFILK
jgi:hypothetical protein